MQRWVLGALCCALSGASAAGQQTLTSPVMLTAPSPFASCGTAGASDTLYVNSAVEPSADIDPTNPLHIAVGYQQDRWSGGGSRGLVASFSFDGG